MRFSLLAAFLALVSGAALAGPTPAPVRAEINVLLTRLESSGCEFNRNGNWYKSAEAKSHLLRKLDYLERNATLRDTEQFIELAATASSSSGQVYQVRCGSDVQSSAQWLARELLALRAAMRPAAAPSK